MDNLQTLGLDPVLVGRIEKWLTAPYDKETIDKVSQLIAQKEIAELTDAFYKDLEFGTGGLRGIVGVGTNRMNRYTIERATQGFSNYLLQHYPGEQIKAAVSFDSRHFSDEFSRLTAEVFAANGIEVYLFSELRPTPHLSFATRELGCHAGVMITASHNPREYSGYKAYWRDGGQLVSPHDEGVIAEVLALTNREDVQNRPLSTHDAKSQIHLLGEAMDESYINAISSLSIRPESVQEQTDLGIVFSSIHGTGITLVPAVLERWGFSNVHIVQKQAQPDGDFPTVIYPNPEEPEAMTLAIEEATRRGSELVLATDPDADRVGMAIRIADGSYQLLNGNEIGSLLVEYVLFSLYEKGRLEAGDYVVKTIVTTGLIRDIAGSWGVSCDDVLTGFKYIGELITQRESEEGKRFVVGGEESFGYLVGELVRDKDAVISCALLAEMAAYFRSKGKSLQDVLLDLYLKHGYYKEKLISLTKKGKSGAGAIQGIMDKLRNEPPTALGGIPIVKINDYKRQHTLDVLSGDQTSLELPRSDVLQFTTADGDIISIRPSGTEPKIKFYCSVREPLPEAADYSRIGQELDLKIERIMDSILQFDVF